MIVRRCARLLLAVCALSALATVGAAGCMEGRPAINQVQPDYLDKSQLIPLQYAALANGSDPGALTADTIRREPQWYHQITIIDKPATTGASGISWYTQVERVNWEVTQDFLVARQAYDRLHGGQNEPGRPPISNNPRQGEIIAMYRIASHFDIRRQYNPTTGEELNVVVENATDRPWYLRRFMRVDWSQNLVSGYSTLAYQQWQGRVRAQPVATYFNNPDDPNRPVFDYGAFRGQDGVLRYFDVTNRTVLHPEEYPLPGLPNLPACALYDRIYESCQPADVLMRVSFSRVDPARDYQPLALDGHRMDRFGFFNSDLHGFNTRLGTPSQLDRRYFAARQNLWMQHHASAPNSGLDHRAGDLSCQSDADCITASRTARCDMGTRTCGEVYVRCAPAASVVDPAMRQTDADRQCASAVGLGSSCDLDIGYLRGDGYGLCLLPYRQRQVRTIAYHLSPNYPDRIMPVTRQVVSEWNRVFSHAVREARFRECLLDPQGGGMAGCASWRDPASLRTEAQDSQFVFVGCHNPVWGTNPNLPGHHEQAQVDEARAQGWDLEACGPQGTVARLGDIRYSMMAAINEFDLQGSWGLANITGDPETGEVLSARGAVWQSVTDSQAAWATDMIRILNRDETVERFALGQTIIDSYDYLQRRAGHDGQPAAQGRPMAFHPRPVFRDIASRADVDTMLNQTTMAHLQTVVPRALDPARIDDLARDSDGRRTDQALLRNLANSMRASLPHGRPGDDSGTRMAVLRGTPHERDLLNRERLLGAGVDPDLPLSEAGLEQASPARRNNAAFRAMQDRAMAELQARECRFDASAASFTDDVITVLLYRFRRNEVPNDVRFGQEWNFHNGSRAACSENLDERCDLNYAEIERYLQQFIHYGVMAHEIGHSVGERHNFSGTVDATNYPDQYWPLRRTAGVPDGAPPVPANELRPRWEHMQAGRPYYSPTEERGGVEEYAYSTVMDYAGFNQDSHGLGRYDRAFVLHGYVDMVEAFDQVADPTNAISYYENNTGGYQTSVRLFFAGSRTAPTPTSYHYTDLGRIVGVDAQGNPNVTDANRYSVFLRETTRRGYGVFEWDPDHTNIAVNNRDGSIAQNPHVLVPYRFGTDDWANYVWNSQRYDAGADMFESMRYVATHYLDYYFSNSFARGRSSFNTTGYRARMIGRYLDQAYYSMRNFVYVNTIYQNAYGGVTGYNNYTNSLASQGARLGVASVMDMFTTAITMPEANAQYETGGRHWLANRVDGTQVYQIDEVPGQPTVDIPVGAGRTFQTSFDWASGFFWRERMSSVGSYHDKTFGLDYMTQTFVWVPGRSVIEWQDVHPLQINAYTIYPGQTLRFFGSLLSRDHDDVGAQIRPIEGAEPEIRRTQYSRLNLPWGTNAGQNGRDPNLRAVDPNLGFTVELDAITYLFGQLQATFDQTAMFSARIWAEGDTWALAPTAERTVVSFTDPLTGLTYGATHMGGAAGEPGAATGLSRRDAVYNETGIAARMLLQANRLADAYRIASPSNRAARRQDLQNYVDLLNQMRAMNRVFFTEYRP